MIEGLAFAIAACGALLLVILYGRIRAVGTGQRLGRTARGGLASPTC